MGLSDTIAAATKLEIDKDGEDIRSSPGSQSMNENQMRDRAKASHEDVQEFLKIQIPNFDYVYLEKTKASTPLPTIASLFRSNASSKHKKKFVSLFYSMEVGTVATMTIKGVEGGSLPARSLVNFHAANPQFTVLLIFEEQVDKPVQDPSLWLRSQRGCKMLLVFLDDLVLQISGSWASKEAEEILSMMQYTTEQRFAPAALQCRGRNGDRDEQKARALLGSIHCPFDGCDYQILNSDYGKRSMIVHYLNKHNVQAVRDGHDGIPCPVQGCDYVCRQNATDSMKISSTADHIERIHMKKVLDVKTMTAYKESYPNKKGSQKVDLKKFPFICDQVDCLSTRKHWSSQEWLDNHQRWFHFTAWAAKVRRPVSVLLGNGHHDEDGENPDLFQDILTQPITAHEFDEEINSTLAEENNEAAEFMASIFKVPENADEGAGTPTNDRPKRKGTKIIAEESDSDDSFDD